MLYAPAPTATRPASFDERALRQRMPAPASEEGRPLGKPILEAQHTDCFICKLRRSWLAGDPFRGASGPQPWLVSGRRSVPRGTPLFRAGDPFRNLYSVHAGQFKSSTLTSAGRTQVTGFHVAGELLGLDGIGAEVHSCDAVALEDAQVCVLSYQELSTMVCSTPALQQEFWRIMSDQIVRDHRVMLWLGSLKAEERVASFLLNLTQRLNAIGYSSSALVLRMSRDEIGSYLGLTLETVSRAFSKFRQQGLLEVKDRDIRIVDRERLAGMGCVA